MGGCTSSSAAGEQKGILPKKKQTPENPTDDKSPANSPGKANSAPASPSLSPLTSNPGPHNHVVPLVGSSVSRTDSTLGQRRGNRDRASLASYAQEDKIELIFKGKRNNIYQPVINAEERSKFQEKKVEKTSQETSLIRSALDQNFCFASLDDHEKRRLSDAMEKLQVSSWKTKTMPSHSSPNLTST